jgi:MFS family permease
MLATALTLLASGMTADITLLSVFRVLAGIGGAAMFISGAALVAARFPDDPARNAFGMALYIGGGGIGIMASAVLLPPLLSVGGAAQWPVAWLVLGSLSIGAWLATWRIVGGLDTQQPDHGPRRLAVPWRRMMPSLAGYFLYGVGYIVYLTFIIAWMRSNDGGVALEVASWSCLGLGVMASSFLWKGLLARHKGGMPLAIACLGSAVTAVIPLIFAGTGGILISAFGFGAVFFMGPAAVTAISKHNLPAMLWSGSIALYTTGFAFGQTLGPIGAGVIADWFGSLDYALIAGSLVLTLAAAVSVLQRQFAQT